MRHHAAQQARSRFPALSFAFSTSKRETRNAKPAPQDPKKKDYRWYGLDLTNGTVRNQVQHFTTLLGRYYVVYMLRCVDIFCCVISCVNVMSRCQRLSMSDLQWRFGADGLQVEVIEVRHRGRAVANGVIRYQLKGRRIYLW